MKVPDRPDRLEVVVCRCGEDLGWIRNLPRGTPWFTSTGSACTP